MNTSIFMLLLITGATYLWSPSQDLTREVIEHCVIWLIFSALIWVGVGMKLSTHVLGAFALVTFLSALSAIIFF